MIIGILCVGCQKKMLVLLTSNLSFTSKNDEKDNVKSIPKLWLVDAKNAQNGGETINRNWFNHHFNRNNFNDCRASVARWLLQNHQPFL